MPDKPLHAFMSAMAGQNKTLKDLFAVIATKLGIRYEHERETERILRTRHEGQWVESKHGGKTWDSGIDHAEENYADSNHNVQGALDKLGRPTAMWYHTRSMCLVIQDKSGEKVGVRSIELRMPLIGLHVGNLNALIEGLKAKLDAN